MKRALLAAATAAALLLTGCGGDKDSGTPSTRPSAGESFTAGALTLEQRPEKIVSLSPVATEMLFAIGAGPQVTAVDDQSNYPADAPRTDLSGFKPNAEAIAAKDPDLVVLSDDADQIVAQLGKLKIPVFRTPAATSLTDTYLEIKDLGSLTGHSGEAVQVTSAMQTGIEQIVASVPARAKPVSYFYELGPELYSATSKTFIGSVFQLFGMTNVADAADADGSKGGYPQLSAESLVASNPDTVFLADTKCCQQSAATVTARKGWASITAVRTGQIYPLDDDIASRWGPRTVDLVQAVADAVRKVPAS
ncbi:ABC transporter substrate-binding protein [Actinoplanes palleronii]|uniref:ABC transporter substrate-binding protein n=1 Tax=Actinoplanes palleronii TaxID=113570 RepID=A0ABQ4BAB1_9ACTN|nr:ABC transporter substrate-binding protein [Actinoplanes palleronii]GIE67644.1 ABC transporter substrate-binding protein [Actinoplanes palleronii]